MTGILHFLGHELRRHLGPLGLGLLLLALLPIARRLQADDFGYWDGAWNVWGAVLALYLLMPALVLGMAASGWARERAADTLEWLYARPLSSGTIFAARAGAVAVSALAWSAVALVMHGVGGTELEQALSVLAGLPGPATLFGLQLALALGAGLYASALAASAESAFRASLLVVAGAWAAAALATRSIAHGHVLLAASRSEASRFLDGAIAAFLFAVAAILVGGAWRLVARTPARSRALGRDLAPVAGATALALAGFAALLHLPLLTGARSPQALWLGGERGLGFAAARGLDANDPSDTMLFAHPVLHEGARERVLRSTFALHPAAWSRGPWPNPARGTAIVQAYLEHGWLLVDAEGGARRLPIDAMGTTRAAGWSPSGDRFAWMWAPYPRPGASADRSRWGEGARILLLERGATLRAIAWPSPVPLRARAAWLDDGTLLLVDPTDAGSDADSLWAVVPIDAAGAGPVNVLPPGRILAAPALTSWYGAGASALPRLDGRPVAVLADARDPRTRLWSHTDSMAANDDAPAPPRLAFLDAANAALELGPELRDGIAPASLGNLDDGSLVWAASDQPLGPPSWGAGRLGKLYRLASAGAVPELLCAMPHGRVAHFLGQSGAWAIWDTILLLDYELWGCNLETGETRRFDEWEPWGHSLATVGDQGIWTPSGWVAMRGGRS